MIDTNNGLARSRSGRGLWRASTSQSTQDRPLESAARRTWPAVAVITTAVMFHAIRRQPLPPFPGEETAMDLASNRQHVPDWDALDAAAVLTPRAVRPIRLMVSRVGYRAHKVDVDPGDVLID